MDNFWPRMFAFVFTAGVAGVWAVFIFWTIQSVLSWRKEKSAPIDQVPAQLSRCYEVEEWVYQFAQQVVASHHLEFETGDGRRLDFSVTPAQYRRHHAGDEGILNIQNGNFVSFLTLTETEQPLDAAGTDAQRVYSRLVSGK